MTLIPRDYQEAAVTSLFDYWANGGKNPVVALPTGTGKALIIARFIQKAWKHYPGTKIVIATHVKELVEQNFETLLKLWPTAPAGIFSAGLGRKDLGRPITFAGIGSIIGACNYFKPDLVFIDECHTVSPKETTTYRKAIAAWIQQNPFLKVAGLSATPYRMGQGMIVEPGGIFTDICFDLTTKEGFNWFLSEGYLKRLVPKPTETEYDISEVRIASTGDYNLHELQGAVDKDSLNRSAVAELVSKGANRKHWLIFAAGVQHAEHITAILNEFGIPAVCVHSKSPAGHRDEATKDFKAGKYRALVNNGIYTTGFDFPGIDLIGVLRHTTSPGLWVQMLGRGTRPVWNGPPPSTREERLAVIEAGTPNCLVLDFARNTARLGPINDVRKPKARNKKDKPGDAPVKICPNCMTYNHASARYCVECKEEFPANVRLQTEASDAELIAEMEMAEEPLEEWFEVETVTYSKHTPWNGKRNNLGKVTPSLRVTFNCSGIRAFTEYQCFEHSGHAKTSACQYWKEAGGSDPAPETIEEALSRCGELKQPQRLRVWINRKNPQVLYHDYGTE